MKITRTARFKKAWAQLSKAEKVVASKALTNLVVDMSYPSLRVKKIKGTDNIWEARASQSIRITFEIKDDTIILRNVGRHDEALGHP